MKKNKPRWYETLTLTDGVASSHSDASIFLDGEIIAHIRDCAVTLRNSRFTPEGSERAWLPPRKFKSYDAAKRWTVGRLRRLVPALNARDPEILSYFQESMKKGVR